jgi:hypothetical protein
VLDGVKKSNTIKVKGWEAIGQSIDAKFMADIMDQPAKFFILPKQ